MRLSRILACITVLTLMAATLSGCFRTTADELYSLPQPSREYLKLQEQLAAVLTTGAEYSPPLAGPNRQSVQLKDLDSDGRNEAIAFFRTTGDKPLKLYILKQTGASYETVDVIDGDGTAIESIRYADLDGDGVQELIIGWRMSATLLHMTVYSIKGGQHTILIDDDYTEISLYDMDSDGNTDVLALRLHSTELPGQADMFSLRSDGEVEEKTVSLSKGLDSITRIQRGSLSDDSPALFVEGTCGGSDVLTDILTWRSGSLYNITSNMPSGVSEDTLRSYAVYSNDINGDGVTEVPIPRALSTSQTDTVYYVIDWYAYNRYGQKDRIFTTYHNFSDGWYLILPEDWKYQITVRRQDSVAGERTMIFSYLTGPETSQIDFLKIYTLSGDNKNDRAKLPGRFLLLEYGDTVYAAEIMQLTTSITVSKAEIVSGFKLWSPDWATGVY